MHITSFSFYFSARLSNLSAGGDAGAIMERPMLRWALAFFIIAIIAAIFGFGGIAGAATNIAQLLFFIFVVLFLVSLVFRLLRG